MTMTVIQIAALILGTIGALASAWYLYERFFPLRRLSWRSAQNAALRISEQMKQAGYDPTLIVGIGRGGAIMGALISGSLGHRPLLVIDRKYMWMDGRRIDDMVLHLQLPLVLVDRVLLVAGEAHSGNTMRLYYNHFVLMGAVSVKRAAYFVRKGCTEPIEYVGIRSGRELRMPWMFTRTYVRDSRSEHEARAIEHCRSSTLAADTRVKTWFVVRHGESTDNESGDRYSGITESTVTENGLRQAESVGRFLQPEGIQKIFSSPMKRAVATARMIQSLTGGQLVIDQRLREIDYGEWEGLTRKEVFARWPESYSRYKEDPVTNTPLAGESPVRVLERVQEFWQEMQHSPSMLGISKIVVVTHNTVTRILLAHLSGTPLKRYRERRIDNASISKVLHDELGKTSVLYENRTDHLV
ncbi:MAG: histidine phosphatase family protein [Candidatus Eisenbacteria bacterium]|nr:histidine phosphatase family protein [Candidatus Eisenbacteria bacterium]